MNARAFTRVSAHHPVTLNDATGRVHKGQLRDVGLGGVFVSGLYLPQGEAVTVNIELSPEARIVGKGMVVRSLQEGVAIALDLLDESESLFHLRNLVLLNTRTPDETQRATFEFDSRLGLKAVPPPA